MVTTSGDSPSCIGRWMIHRLESFQVAPTTFWPAVSSTVVVPPNVRARLFSVQPSDAAETVMARRSETILCERFMGRILARCKRCVKRK